MLRSRLKCSICGSGKMTYRDYKLCSQCYYRKRKVQTAFDGVYPDGFDLESYLKEKAKKPYITKSDYIKVEVYEFIAKNTLP
ncbi:MAG TPA: hypothetical protein V6C58_03355 [Allocoleopsis sp.]